MDNRHDTDTSHSANQSGRRTKAVLIAVGIWLILAVCVAMITHYQAARTHLERADLRLQELAYRLEIELDRYRSLPKVLAMHPWLNTTLTRTERSSGVMLNGLLSEYSQGIASDVVRDFIKPEQIRPGDHLDLLN